MELIENKFNFQTNIILMKSHCGKLEEISSENEAIKSQNLKRIHQV